MEWLGLFMQWFSWANLFVQASFFVNNYVLKTVMHGTKILFLWFFLNIFLKRFMNLIAKSGKGVSNSWAAGYIIDFRDEIAHKEFENVKKSYLSLLHFNFP